MQVFLNSAKSWLNVFVLVCIVAGGLVTGSATQAATEKPEQKIWRAFAKLSEARSLTYQGSLAVAGNLGGKPEAFLLGKNVAAKKAVPAYETLTIEFKGGDEIFTRNESQSWNSLLFTSSDKKAPFFGIETRSVGGNTYAMLSRVANMPSGLENFTNIWINLDIAAFLKEIGFDAFLQKEARWIEPTARQEQKKKITQLVLKSNVIKVRSAAVKKSGNVTFDVYNFTIEKTALKKLLTELAVATGQPLSAREAADLNKKLADIKTITGQVWISKKDGFPTRINVDMIGRGQKAKTNFQMSFKNINQPITVSEPASYLTIRQLVEMLFPGAMSALDKQSSAL